MIMSLIPATIRLLQAIAKGFRDSKFKGLSLLVGILLFSGTMFYAEVEEWRMIDALYFSVTTLTTVGNSSLEPVTDAGKIFTMVYLFGGVGVLLSFINQVAYHVEEQSPAKRFFKGDQTSTEQAPGSVQK